MLSYKLPKSLPHYTPLFSRNLCYMTIWSWLDGPFHGLSWCGSRILPTGLVKSIEMILAENTDNFKCVAQILYWNSGLKIVKFPYKRGYSSPVHTGSPKTLICKSQLIALKGGKWGSD